MDDNKDMEIRDITRLIEETVDAAVVKDAAKKEAGCDHSSCGCGKTCALDIAYPSLDGIEEDTSALKIVSPAYAGDEGELTAVLQYVYQHILFDNMGCKDYADILIKVAITEMKHLEILGSLILKLGAAPVYSYLPPYPINYYSARSVSYSKTPQKMILDDIAAEQYAIDTYTKMLCRIKNERIAAVIQRIRMDEEGHLATFKCILKELTSEK
ncbi:MAG: manganese catalase family protein [Firmicutes bacterium]|jgi:rubrerythrin|nr:manganese catalase family protein [Bacillota bacterium]